MLRSGYEAIKTVFDRSAIYPLIGSMDVWPSMYFPYRNRGTAVADLDTDEKR